MMFLPQGDKSLADSKNFLKQKIKEKSECIVFFAFAFLFYFLLFYSDYNFSSDKYIVGRSGVSSKVICFVLLPLSSSEIVNNPTASLLL